MLQGGPLMSIRASTRLMIVLTTEDTLLYHVMELASGSSKE